MQDLTLEFPVQQDPRTGELYVFVRHQKFPPRAQTGDYLSNPSTAIYATGMSIDELEFDLIQALKALKATGRYNDVHLQYDLIWPQQGIERRGDDRGSYDSTTIRTLPYNTTSNQTSPSSQLRSSPQLNSLTLFPRISPQVSPLSTGVLLSPLSESDFFASPYSSPEEEEDEEFDQEDEDINEENLEDEDEY
ncbi:hypothetical protein pv_409 [Pithovirus sibericum]|uniref:Uncharacterized protein n=1 Tax=Pithovirus sibericum TaxID=1450746 RepID=W5SB01_9VIRU|nr:hypothetical protein pv_409 [Pithovirus sibericum]AHH01975.1 hypothetical protein pv_409 [Pithovirus sibericum]